MLVAASGTPKWGLKVKDCQEGKAKVEMLVHGPEEGKIEASENPPFAVSNTSLRH